MFQFFNLTPRLFLGFFQCRIEPLNFDILLRNLERVSINQSTFIDDKKASQKDLLLIPQIPVPFSTLPPGPGGGSIHLLSHQHKV